MTAWTILVKGHQGNMSAKLHWNLSSGFQQEDFFKFSIKMYRENKPRPLAAIFFWQIMTAWTILVNGYQGNISAKLYWNRSSGFWQEDFFSSFLYRYIGKISPAPLQPRFDESWLLEQPWQRVTKDTFLPCYIETPPPPTPPLVHWFLTRRFLKFSI